MRGLAKVVSLFAAVLLLSPGSPQAQELASIAGTVRDSSGGVLPGATVEVTSPALIEKVRSTTSDSNGQYRIAGLPIGRYEVTFSLPSFSSVRRQDILLTSGFTATVDASMAVGNLTETIVVAAETPTVDVQNARQATVFTGDDLKDLPAVRNVSSIMNLVPGITLQTGVLNSAGGVCVGGAGVWCSPNVYAFNAHTSQNDAEGMRQGRLMVDGMVLNTASNPVSGALGGYVADLTNAAEVSFSLSGALGESETGGTSINIVPRTGGNRFAGNYFTNYTRGAWFDRNDGTHKGNPVTGAPAAQANIILSDHDITGSFGGPIRRDRLWFYSVARTQGKESSQNGGPFYHNKNAGIWGMNYQPDRTREPITYTNMWRNVNTRLTWQATQGNKFNFFWDEQDACQDPCDGTVAAYWSPEAMWSVHTHPNRIGQVSWTNPRTNRLLLEGGVNVALQRYNFSKHRYVDNPTDIPQIMEMGVTAGLDEVATRVNQVAGGEGFFGALRSGSIAEGNIDNYSNYRTRLSASYVTGSHNAKVGWEGAFYGQEQNVVTSDPRMVFDYRTPGATCYNPANPAASTCGNTSLHFPSDPYNSVRRPVPSAVTINVGPRTFDERVTTNALYVQDQWTFRNVTLNGALRYDHATSKYFPTCVGPDRFVPVGYCTPEQDGVSFNNITPRWSAAWNVFGDGRTAIKWNMGKYLSAAGFQDVFNGANPARRTQNTLSRNWEDLNGNRIPDCDFTNPAEHFTGGDRCAAVTNLQTFRRFGTDPYVLDEQGDAIGLATTHCGRTETGIPAAVQAYCSRSGQNLLEGWDMRRGEWQFGLALQREILPRLSAEVSYNQRWYQNLSYTDTLGVGCDLYADNTDACVTGMQNYSHPQYSFYAVRAPQDERLPNGGGYLIQGLNDRNTQAALSGPNAITRQQFTNGWKGIDTNFVYRMAGGLRLNGGTSTGNEFSDRCDLLDTPDVRMRDGGDSPSCAPTRPWQTNIRGSATYTIPWVDVLTSVTFQSRPGAAISANLQYSYQQVMWAPGSEWRATNTVGCPTTGASAAPVGCLYGVGNSNQFGINLLDTGDMYGERISLADVKFAKNFRFSGKRLNVGVDVYNVTNSDAVVAYNNTYTIDNPATPAVEQNLWMTPTTLLAPRFARLTVQFDF